MGPIRTFSPVTSYLGKRTEEIEVRLISVEPLANCLYASSIIL